MNVAHLPFYTGFVDKNGETIQQGDWLQNDEKKKFIVILSSFFGYTLYDVENRTEEKLDRDISKTLVRIDIEKP